MKVIIHSSNNKTNISNKQVSPKPNTGKPVSFSFSSTRARKV